MSAEPGGRVLNVEQAAEFLSVTRRWLVREGIRKHKIPFMRPPKSNRIFFLESDLWRVLESWRQSSTIGTGPTTAAGKATSRRGSTRKKAS